MGSCGLNDTIKQCDKEYNQCQDKSAIYSKDRYDPVSFVY